MCDVVSTTRSPTLVQHAEETRLYEGEMFFKGPCIHLTGWFDCFLARSEIVGEVKEFGRGFFAVGSW